MIVLDASAYAAALVDLTRRGEIARASLRADPHWAVPDHFIAESTNALRGLWLGRKLSDREFDASLDRLRDSRLDTWPTLELLPRVRQLAANAAAYDAAYIALAEHTGSTLLAGDRRMSRVPGVTCRVVVAE